MHAHKHALTLLTISDLPREKHLLLRSVRLASQMMEVALSVVVKALKLHKASQVSSLPLLFVLNHADFPLG